MKRFIKQLAVFIVIFICGLSAYLAFLFKFNEKLIEGYKFDKKINKLIVGDSYTRYSINEMQLANTRNISQNSEALLYSYFKLKSLLINNPQIDTVLLGVSYHSFSSYYIEIEKDPITFSRYCFILPLSKQIGFLKDMKNTFPMIQNSIIAGTKNLIQNAPDSSFLGGFDAYSTTISLSDELIEKRIRYQYFNDCKLYNFFEENIIYFGKIKELCKDMNVKLIVLNTPIHSRYKEKIPPKFINEFNSIVKNGDIGIIEFDGLSLSDNDFLPDGDHLRESGARLSTLYLYDLLNKKSVRKTK